MGKQAWLTEWDLAALELALDRAINRNEIETVCGGVLLERLRNAKPSYLRQKASPSA